MKTVCLEQKKNTFIGLHGDMPDAKAERIVKASDDWAEYIKTMVAARTKANQLKQQLAYFEMKHREWISADANARKELGL